MDSLIPWKITFYNEGNGTNPVAEFIKSLPVEDRACVQKSLDKLISRNISAKEPLVCHVRGPFWELRAIRCTNTYRLIYIVDRDRRIVILHGFLKKTQKTPDQDLMIARKRYERLVARS